MAGRSGSATAGRGAPIPASTSTRLRNAAPKALPPRSFITFTRRAAEDERVLSRQPRKARPARSIGALLIRHIVVDLDRAGDDIGRRLVGRGLDLGRDERLVDVVERIADA